MGWNLNYVSIYIIILNSKQMKAYSRLNYLHLWNKMHVHIVQKILKQRVNINLNKMRPLSFEKDTQFQI